VPFKPGQKPSVFVTPTMATPPPESYGATVAIQPRAPAPAPRDPAPLPPPTTNILQLPVVECTVQTGNNEDWIDGFAFYEDSAATIPIPLDGIVFEMEVRANPPEYSVVIRGSTHDGTLTVVHNVLQMNIRASQMASVPPQDYVFDVVAYDGYRHRIIIRGTQMTVFEGITR
jgi:hypothetical protein